MAARTTTVSAMIDTPQLKPHAVVEERQDRLDHVDQRLEDVGEDGHGARCGAAGRAPNRRCASTGSKPPWLNGLQRSRRQPARTSPAVCRTAGSPGSRRPSRSARTGSGAERGRDPACQARDRCQMGPVPRRTLRSAPPAPLRARRRRPSRPRARPARAPRVGRRARSRGRWAARRPAPRTLRAAPLDPVAVDGAADLAARPRRRAARRVLVVRRGGTRRARGSGALRGALAVDAVELAAARKPPARAGRAPAIALDGQPLPPFAAPALEDARPPRVLMRARNPWVFARLRFFGW